MRRVLIEYHRKEYTLRYVLDGKSYSGIILISVSFSIQDNAKHLCIFSIAKQ